MVYNEEGLIILPVAGFIDDDPIGGETSIEILIQFFGDISEFKQKLTSEEYQSIIQRCEKNEWEHFKLSFEMWRNEGKI